MTTDLAIRLTADASDAADSFDSVGDAALRMADDVDRGTRDADAAASRLDGAAEAADGMASSSSQAAGGLGDLGGALSLLPGPLGALGSGMEAVAPAIMGVTGAADLANLALESNVVQTVRAKAAAIAHGVATKAQAVATGAATIAQRAFNLAMAANPIGIAVLAATALIAGFVLLYKRSERFRAVVDRVMQAVRGFIARVVDILKVVGSWVKDKIPDYFRLMLKVATLQWRLMWMAAKFAVDKVVDFVGWLRDKVVAAWEWIKDKGGAAWDWYVDKVRRVIEVVRGVIDKVRDTVGNVASKIRSALGGAFDWVADKVQVIIDKVQDIIDAVASIGDKIPDIPGIPGLRTVAPAAPTGTTSTSGWGDTSVTIQMPLVGGLSQTETGLLVKALDDYYASRGLRVSVVPR